MNADREVSRRIGVGLYTGQSLYEQQANSYQDLTTLVAAAEEAGFDSFWVSEHHGLADGYLPSPLPALAAAAAVTRSIQLGTGVALAPLHHPIRLAEDAAVVDQLSRGRLILGLGLGYAADEYRAFNVDLSTRGARLEELVGFLRYAWRGERFSGAGTHIGVTDVRVAPRPWNGRAVPIWLGGYAAAAVRRAGDLADGHLVGKGTPEVIASTSEALRSVRSPVDRRFVRAVNVACVLEEIGGGAASARHGFARQQLVYDRIQSGRDVYGGLVAMPSDVDGFAQHDIDAHIQVAGDADQVVSQLSRIFASLSEWANLHVILRLLFAEPDPQVQLDRLTVFGERILPRLRADLRNEGRA